MMERKLIITKKDSRVFTSLMENGSLREIQVSAAKTESCEAKPGNIYIGRVKKINSNIGAAFIEIAPNVECYYALNQSHTPVFTRKIGKKPLCIGDELIVQISREAAKGKAPTVTTDFSLTGSFAVLTHGNTVLGVSNKIDAERKRELKEWLEDFQNEQYGLILRTNASGAEKEKIFSEINTLISLYQDLVEHAPHRTCFSCLKRELPDYLVELRNVYLDGLTEIVVGETSLYEQVQEYLEQERPEALSILRKYEDSLLPLHKLYSIDTELQRALSERVWLKNGGYLVIQPTEALTVIDVNSGKCIQGRDAQKTFLKINLEAAREAARQIRLRNLSGIIIVDFINLDEPERVTDLLNVFRTELSKDPVKTVLVDITKLHLVEVTRKKVRRPLAESLKE